MIEKVLTCRWSFLPYILDIHSTLIQRFHSVWPIHIISNGMTGWVIHLSSENTEKKTYYLSSYTRESQLLRLRSTLTQIISYCVTSLFNQGQVRVFWFLETRPKNNRNYDNRESNETEITPHSLLVNSILKLFFM